jgi:pimeloyl-ACP methyl ester carboxylesterase
MALLARFGGKGLVRKATVPHGFSPEMSTADVDIMWRDYLCVEAMRAGGREARQILAALPTMRRLETEGSPHVPTVSVYGARVDRGMAKLRPALNANAAALMAAVPGGRMVVVEGAGHLVPQERPAEVRDAILDVVAAVRVST